MLRGTVGYDTNLFGFKVLYTVEKVSAFFFKTKKTLCRLEETLEHQAKHPKHPKPPENLKSFPGPFPSVLLIVNSIPLLGYLLATPPS